MRKALLVGRFQPFHNGHLSAIKKILEENDRVIIVIGSTNESMTPDNPLTVSERFQIIEESLKEAEISCEKFRIIPVPNINNFATWPNHVKSYVPPFDRLYTGSKVVRTCFENSEENIEIIHLDRDFELSATKVRKAIRKDDDWEKLVPPKTAQLLKEWNIPNRLK